MLNNITYLEYIYFIPSYFIEIFAYIGLNIISMLFVGNVHFMTTLDYKYKIKQV